MSEVDHFKSELLSLLSQRPFPAFMLEAQAILAFWNTPEILPFLERICAETLNPETLKQAFCTLKSDFQDAIDKVSFLVEANTKCEAAHKDTFILRALHGNTPKKEHLLRAEEEALEAAEVTSLNRERIVQQIWL